MNVVKYRFNRKTGRIYQDSQEKLTDVGDRLKVIILWASEPIWGKPFLTLPAQYWIQLTFIDQQENWCYAMLNSGTTNALYPWIEYRKQLEKTGELFEFVTTISFLNPESGQHEWFEYNFSGVRGKPGIKERMRRLLAEAKPSLIANSNQGVIDLDLVWM